MLSRASNLPPSHPPQSWPRPRWRRWLGVFLLGLVGLSAAPESSAADSESALEYKVKAGYLFNFAKFIEWPSSAFPSTNSPFVIGVLDNGEAYPTLRSLFDGKSVNGHPVEIKSTSIDAIDKRCHILLITRLAEKTPEDLRQSIGATPILMVGETDEFAERGGAIAFVREGESVRLTLCVEHATENGLKVSAKLASVAKPVNSKRKK